MERIPSKLAGLCSGAIWNSERIFSWTCLVTRQLSGKNSPPCADARRVVGNRLVEFELLLADGFVREIAFRKADALDQTFGEQFAGLGFHVDHLVFDRRTAAVEY